MKTPLLLTLFALCSSAALAADSETPPPKPTANTPVPAKPEENPPVAVSGKATVTIDVNGQKVTREVDLGKAMQLNLAEGLPKIVGGTLTVLPETRTWLGVAADEPSDEVRAQLPVANGTGLLVQEVIPDSPAAKAGLQKNDVLTRLDDQILTNPSQLRALVGLKKEGDTIRVTYLRKGQEASVEAKLASHAETAPSGGGILENLGKLIFSGASVQTTTKTEPLVLQRSGALDKNGNVVFTINAPTNVGKDGSKDAEQWHLFYKDAHADVTDAMKKLEKSLHEAGLSDDAIAKTRQSVAEAIAQIQKAVGAAAGSRQDIERSARNAAEELRRALEQAWGPEEGEASKESLKIPRNEPLQVAPKKAP